MVSLQLKQYKLSMYCFQTAVIQDEHDDIHLVAMKSRKNPSTGATTRACFWGLKVSRSLFSTCLAMLKQRRLGIVFGLDDTLIVANTTRTFKVQINSLRHKISCERDPFRVSGMKSQIERYCGQLLLLNIEYIKYVICIGINSIGKITYLRKAGKEQSSSRLLVNDKVRY